MNLPSLFVSHGSPMIALDQSRIKDLRTGVEIGNTTAVLDGDLNPFLEESLKQGL